MVDVSNEAERLNGIIEREAPHISHLLSKSGLKAHFPKSGILAQTKEAANTTTNATIGTALEDDGSPMILEAFASQSSLSTRQTFLYSPSYGQKQLREFWSELIRQKNPSLQTAITSPVVVSGLTHGLYIVGRLFINQGDRIITPDKFWENYMLTFEHANFDEFSTFRGQGFNVRGLEDKLSGNGQKKVVLLNFPNNPSGYTPSEEEIEDITQVIKQSAERGNEIVAIVDDAYFGLVYKNGIYRESIFTKLADLDKRVLAVKVDGLSKEAYSWGFRVGFVAYGFKGMTDEVASALEDKTAGTVRGTTSNITTHSQIVALNGMKSPDFQSQAARNYAKLKERYDVINQTLASHPDYREVFEALPFNSGYFMCVELKNNNAEQVRHALLNRDDSVGLIAQGNLLRIAYSSVGKEKIPQLFDGIYQVAKGIQAQ